MSIKIKRKCLFQSNSFIEKKKKNRNYLFLVLINILFD